MSDDDHIPERLARIEAHQESLTGQSNFILQEIKEITRLLSRIVRVEENVSEQHRSVKRCFLRLEKVEAELDSWKTARRILIWLITILSSLVSVYLISLING